MENSTASGGSSALSPDDLEHVLATLEDLVRRTDAIISEVGQLVDVVTAASGGTPAFSAIPGLASFSRGLAVEKAGLKKLQASTGDPAISGKIKAVLAAANIPHYEARWATVKRRHELVSMSQVFRRQDKWTFPALKKPNTKGLAPGQAKDLLRHHRIQNSAECDAVVEGGAEWIKVSAASHRRWIQQMADAGLFIDTDDNDEEEDGDGDDGHDRKEEREEEEDIVILRMIRHLVEASRANPCKLRSYPRVRLVLTKIEEGRVKEIDWLINKLRRLGARSDVEVLVDCANGEFLKSPIPPIDKVLQKLVLAPENEKKLLPSSMSATLNVDANVLLGYISDITNSHCEIEPWHKPEMKHYIEMENSGGEKQRFVPHINSIVQDHPLVCIRSVMDNFRRIVTTIATDTERARYRLVMPWAELDPEDQEQLPGGDAMTSEQRVQALQVLSHYEIPSCLHLPVRVVDGDWDLLAVERLVGEGSLPPYAVPVVRGMGTAAVGSLVYGWHVRLTTVTGCFNFVDRFMSLIELYGRDHPRQRRRPRSVDDERADGEEEKKVDVEFEVEDPAQEAPEVIKVPLFRSLLAKRRPSNIPPPPRRVKQGDHWRGVKIVPPGMEEAATAEPTENGSTHTVQEHEVVREAKAQQELKVV